MRLDTGIAIATSAIALAAFFLSWRADQRAKALARTQMFLDLRARFLEVFQNLPAFDKAPSDYTSEDRMAVLAYWHHTFDEWYVTNRLSHKYLKQLWDEFYGPAVLAGMKHPGYRAVLFEMIESRDRFGEYRSSFGDAMKELWQSSGISSNA